MNSEKESSEKIEEKVYSDTQKKIVTALAKISGSFDIYHPTAYLAGHHNHGKKNLPWRLEKSPVTIFT